jgi:amino acid adenylation domain-containing protein
MYTSGSTGRPKGTAIEQRGIVRLVMDTNYARFGPDEVLLQFATMSFDASTMELWGSLLHGGRLVISPPGKVSLEELPRLLVDHQVSVMFMTTAVFHQMVERHLPELVGVRQVMAGGEVQSVAHFERALAALPEGHRLSAMYGPTESTTFTSYHPMERGSRIGATVPIGRPVANTWVHVLDGRMQRVPAGVAGELYVGGDGLAREYLNQPELTAEKFVASPFGEGRLYRSGDLVRWLPGGTLEFLGRGDKQVKLRGFRIELGEIEAALNAHPAVLHSVVVVRGDDTADKRLVAYIVKDTQAAPTLTEDGAVGAGEETLVSRWREHPRSPPT